MPIRNVKGYIHYKAPHNLIFLNISPAFPFESTTSASTVLIA